MRAIYVVNSDTTTANISSTMRSTTLKLYHYMIRYHQYYVLRRLMFAMLNMPYAPMDSERRVLL